MKYFKNTELAKLYHVSEKSVRNWIQSAREGKLDLQIHAEKNRSYVANTTKNIALIEQLVQKGRKYKNTRGFKTISPKKEFYEIYSHKQILDIISNITVHHEIPLQYSYVNGGAESWNQYSNRLAQEETANILTRSIELLDVATQSIDQTLYNNRKINIVDLGPGNGLPVRHILKGLLEQGRLNRYIAIDISQDMLDILESNIKEWFGDSIRLETYVRDISYERFDDLLADDLTNDSIASLVLLLGGTLSNFRAPSQLLQAINNSMGIDDLFMYTGYLDTPKTRRYFDFHTGGKKLPVQSGLILGFLNIDESLYDVEQIFNEKTWCRSISAKPKVDLSITFELMNGTRHIELRKNQPILLWRHRHYNAMDLLGLFDKNDLDLQMAAKSPEQNYFLLVSKIKTNTYLG